MQNTTTEKKMFLQLWERECSTTLRVLRAYPAGLKRLQAGGEVEHRNESRVDPGRGVADRDSLRKRRVQKWIPAGATRDRGGPDPHDGEGTRRRGQQGERFKR